MILSAQAGYEPVDERFQQLFNSYYESLGDRVERSERGLMTRPSLQDVLAYRQEIDRRMAVWLQGEPRSALQRYLFELGLHHDQQHQELFLMDILHLMSRSPLGPAAFQQEPRAHALEPAKGGWSHFDGGLTTLGADAVGFGFDNEGPAHPVWVQPFRLADDLVTNADWLRFIEDGGYRRADLWLSDGWRAVEAEAWKSPLYWRTDGDGWSVMTLAGRRAVDPAMPVRHISFYEADAFARWSGNRLPTEAEWEHAAKQKPAAFSNLAAEVWQWTSSAYAPYPGFAPTAGTAAEYNGKFMANQMVLRGGSFATPKGHARVTYRNFFYPHQRWAFAGLRLARDASMSEADDHSPATAAFRKDLLEGLSRDPKSVPPKWLYDAQGSRLFEAITTVKEYYPTRQEMGLLRTQAASLAAEFGPGSVLVEFGSGASEKTRILLDAAGELRAYVPLDISETALAEAGDRIAVSYPALSVRPVLGDFERLGPLPDDLPTGRRIGFFPGSTIGNFEPDEAVAFMTAARRILGEGALFILGVDVVKDPAVLIAAYDDAQGVTAAFNLNLLKRANEELSADFDLGGFVHRAVWNEAKSCMEMHLEALRPMVVRMGQSRFTFAKGETLHTESSRKFTRTSVEALAEDSGWVLRRFEMSSDPAVALAVFDT